MRRLVALSLVTGHAGALMDAPREPPSGPALRDQRLPFLVLYTAQEIADWRLEHGSIVGVKLTETVPELDITANPLAGAQTMQWLLWDRNGWARFDIDGKLVNADEHRLGFVPLAVMRPKPSMTRPFLGRPLIANAKILQALFNRMSELDQVVRDQSSSLLVVEVDEHGDVEEARKQLGAEYGIVTVRTTDSIVRPMAFVLGDGR